ncbi:MAG: phosphoglycerate dehydrogenase [Gammaproteobacteria bacterium]|nr:phosphoglycerate dehydrogenase [Gammaproteobacteria bacterium]
MTTPRVLISDKMSSQAAEVFKNRGIEVVQSPNLSAEELADIIGDFDGLAVRSSTRVTPQLLEKATRLKAIGRAGIGVDNIDVAACTEKGTVVMNTPFGNAITTAEHTLAMMFALARHIPQANASTHQGLWEKSKFMGTELTGKLLGLIGAGNIGSIVIRKALGVGLRVQAYDPFLTEERAETLGIKKVTMDELLSSSDIVTLHVPKTPETANIIDATALNKMKKGAMLINCARGGLVDETALHAALTSGHLHGAALDVYEVEPAKDNALFNLPNIICTPHLGASTQEAQEKVAVQIADQLSDYLLDGAISNALNAPNLTAEEALHLGPYLRLIGNLGAFAGQLTHDPIKSITVNFSGDVTQFNVEPLVTKAVQEILAPRMCNVNAVNAQQVARHMGIHITSAKDEVEDEFHNRISLTISTNGKARSVSGTLFRKIGRLVEIKGMKLESEFGEHMLYLTNEDRPGVIGAIGMFAANKNINIANMHLGRHGNGGDAIALLEVDAPIDTGVLAELRELEHIQDANYLNFNP